MHSFEVHSDESVCRKKVHLGLEQVIKWFRFTISMMHTENNMKGHAELLQSLLKSSKFPR